MTYRSGVVSGVISTVLIIGALLGLRWLITGKAIEPNKSALPPIPATVPKTANEGQFNTVILKKEAEESLKLSYGYIDKKPMPRSRFYGGEITIPPGRTIIVSAPFSGILQTAGGVMPVPGEKVTKGSPIFQLAPLLTPEGRANLASSKVDAEGLVQNAETQLKAADINLKLAKKLLMDDVGSQRAVNDAEAAHNLAVKVLDAARERLKTLVKITGEVEKGTAAPIPIEAPADGILRTVSAGPGQNVPGGAALFEVLDLNTVWIRVPVYVGDREAIDERAPALIGSLAAKPNEKFAKAKYKEAPPSANALAGSVDLFYELDNRATKYSPGHRVGVTLSMTTEAESLTVPWGAILYDVNGGTWVYEAGADHTYYRKRVQVHHIDGETAVLTSGPPKGTKVVVDGAAELFGTETGYSK